MYNYTGNCNKDLVENGLNESASSSFSVINPVYLYVTVVLFDSLLQEVRVTEI